MAAYDLASYQVAVPAIAGLTGVLVGGWISTRNQKIERRHKRIAEQLGFYSVLVGIRAEIREKSAVRAKFSALADKCYQEELAEAGEHPIARKNVADDKWPQYEKLMDYNDEQTRTVILPLYDKMLEHVTTNMGLAEPTTRGHYAALVEFVEIWRRAQKQALPTRVIREINHREANLDAFYADIETQFERLQAEMNEKGVGRLRSWIKHR